MDKIWAIWAIFLSIISSVEFWKIAGPIVLGILLWYWNEQSKTQWERARSQGGIGCQVY
jgi:hypothetical protein